MTTVYAKTEFYNGTTLEAMVEHTSASSIPTLTLDADVNATKYDGDVVTSVLFTPLDSGLTAERHTLQIVGTCATTLEFEIPDAGGSYATDQYSCAAAGWNLQIRTKPRKQ